MPIRHALKLLAVPAVLLALTGCAGFSGVPVAPIFVETITPVQTTSNEVGKKYGEACASNFLGLLTMGDASIRAAAKEGGVKHISVVDVHYTSIFVFYAKYCTVVSGKG